MKTDNLKMLKGSDGLFYLYLEEMTNEVYDEIKPIIEHLNGHWREKYGCFVFGEDVSELLSDALCNGIDISDDYRWREENQFYPTPKDVAQRVVELADVKSGMSILEPSAGQGALLECIPIGEYKIQCVEPMEVNYQILKKKGYFVFKNTFEDVYSNLPKFDRVIMNPPFSGQRDIKHVMMAFNLLNKGGVLSAVISENALYYKTEVTKSFLKFLKENNGYIESVPSRSFKESGTTIETVLVKVVKKD